MDGELKNLLEENLKLSKENNELLIKVRRVQKWAQYSRVFYWFIIIGITFGAFYFIQPYLENLLNLYTGGVGISNTSIKEGLSNTEAVSDLIKELNQ